MKKFFLTKGLICDEGSSLVMLVGQIKNKSLEASESDFILDAMRLDDEENESFEVDTVVNNARIQVKEIEKEIESFIFKNQIRISSENDYSNSDYSAAPVIIDAQINDQEIFHLTNDANEKDGRRKLRLIKTLNITMGNLKSLQFYLFLFKE